MTDKINKIEIHKNHRARKEGRFPIVNNEEDLFVIGEALWSSEEFFARCMAFLPATERYLLKPEDTKPPEHYKKSEEEFQRFRNYVGDLLRESGQKTQDDSEKEDGG